jgi:alkylation response protein AidB-like acyl-CoA dehydrogenase
MIPRSESGITVERPWNAAGMRGTTSHTIRYDAVVGQPEIIGTPGQLLTVGLSGFALGYAATYLGVAEAALEFIINYASVRVLPPATDPISHHPLTQGTIGEMATSVKAARLLLLDAAQAKDAGDPEATTLAVNQAKYYAAEVAVSVTEKAIRLAGGSGILKSYPLERWHRDALAGPVMPPSNDRCLETIGRVLCGLRAATLEFQ